MPTEDKEKERIWNIYTELGLIERHFNSLQSGYRALASTWLLAAFAGIGFVLSTKLTLLIPSGLIIAGIGIGASIGIYLLWILDLLVNQRLLDAAFIEARNLETRHKWLPQYRNNIRTLLGGKGLALIVWFYIGCTEVMAFVGGVGLFLWLPTITIPVVIYITTIIYVIGMGLVLLYMRRRTSITPYLESQINQSRGSTEDRSL
jgi:hypothetical protein